MNNEVISGRYCILNVIGIGGMSIVYRAKDLKTGKIVALKVLKDEYQKNEEFVRRFRHEAMAAAQMSHPNIVKLFSVEDDGERQYLVMEYVEGRTLKEVIEQEGRLKSTRAVAYVIKILAALDHAHKNNIIHRDIKPQNILVDPDDNIKVADFGIARLVNSSTGTLSDSNSVLGSVHYVSPEQANGEPVDTKSDLYSVGIVLYEMLTGTVPFDGETPVAIALKQVQELPRSMRTLFRDIPRGLDEVVMKALEKSPQMRYESAAEMAKDLKRALKIPEGGFVNNSASDSKIRRLTMRNGLNILLVVLSCITVIAIFVYGFIKVSDILYGVDVPYVTGIRQEDAVKIIEEDHMNPVITEQYSASYARGTVISQLPEGGTRSKRDETVKLTVSLGVQPVELPDTIGMNVNRAMSLLSEKGFTTYNVEYTWDPAYDEEAVLNQTPNEGTASVQEVITLTVNSPMVEVPNLCGLSAQEATERLEQVGLKVRVHTGYSPDDVSDIVIMQSLAAHSETIKGSVVEIGVTLKKQINYYATYNLRVPFTANVRIELVAPSGGVSVVYSADADADSVISLDLTDKEGGGHKLNVYFNDVLQFTQALEFV